MSLADPKVDPCQGQEPDLDPYQSQEPDRDPYQSQEPDLDLFLCQQPDLDPYQGITCSIMRAGEGGRLRHTHMKLLALNNNKMNIKCVLVLNTIELRAGACCFARGGG